jgi:hypothetical protein
MPSRVITPTGREAAVGETLLKEFLGFMLKATSIVGSIAAILALVIVLLQALVGFVGFISMAIKVLIVLVFIAVFAAVGFMVFRASQSRRKHD